MRKEKIAQSRQHVVIIALSFVVLTAVVLILKVSYLQRIAKIQTAEQVSEQAGSLFTAFNIDFVNMVFFHVILIQALVSGAVMAYMQSGKLRQGLKWMIALTVVGIVLWVLTVAIV